MNILIVGCGRVGSELAITLEQKGHDVCVLDESEHRLSLVRSKFHGLLRCGIVIDDDALKQAGITSCHVVCAVTDDDNTNIMVSMLARDIYGVKKVITRVYDSVKHDIYEGMGLQCIDSTSLTLDAVCAAIEEPEYGEQYYSFLSHTCRFLTVKVTEELADKPVSGLPYSKDHMIIAVVHGGGEFEFVQRREIILNTSDTLIMAKVID